MTKFLDQLKAVVGDGGWTTDKDELQPRLTEWRGVVEGATDIALFPSSTQEVSKIVQLCASNNVGIVPQGGNTGMCAGAVPDDSGEQVLLCLEKMNSILDVDADNFSIEVEAGCILANIQDAAKNVNRFFALSLSAEGSCQIGGNLSTNAGGVNVVRYGTARAQVLGIEAVLADGSIVNSMRALRKDTAGYDLKQLFIGSEGTLGIITAATLKLHPTPEQIATALVALDSPADAVKLLARLRSDLSDRVEAFELISDVVMQLIQKHIPDTTVPMSTRSKWFVLMDAAIGSDVLVLEEALHSALDAGLIRDAVLAKNEAEAQHLWRIRHSTAEAERAEGKALKHDISVPVSKLAEFLERGDVLLKTIAPEALLMAFGHVGDGNLHYNVSLPAGFEDPLRVSAAIYELVGQFGGSFSAEHGVGSVKREYLARYRSAEELALMRTLKVAMDPKNIMNPGKVI